MSLSEEIEVESLVRIVLENVFFEVVQYSPLTGQRGWVGGCCGAMCFMLLLIFLQDKMNSDTGEMKIVYMQEMLKRLLRVVNLTQQMD